jgi:hypothetical protein
MRGWAKRALPGLLMVAQAVAGDLDAYLVRVRDRHPYFAQQAHRVAAERARAASVAGGEDWEAGLRPAWQHIESVPRTPFAPRETETFSVAGTLERPVWRTGGRLDLALRHEASDQRVDAPAFTLPGGENVDLAGPAQYFENRAGIAYTHPLWQDRGGVSSRAPADIQWLVAEEAELAAREGEEAFLEGAAVRYIEWALAEEEGRIGGERLRLAEEELGQSERKRSENLVEAVDVARARLAVLDARRVLRLIESRAAVLRVEVALRAGATPEALPAPSFDLFERRALPDTADLVARVRRDARDIRRLACRARQAQRAEAAARDAAAPRLDLILSAGLQGRRCRARRVIRF